MLAQGHLPDVHSQKGGAHPVSATPGGRDVELPALNTQNLHDSDVPDDMPPTPRRKSADQMPSFEIMEHLRKRNCVPSGFYEDDQRQLQIIFDEDYEKQRVKRQAYLETVNANRKENYTKELARRKQQRDEMEINTAVKNNPRVPVWLELVKAGKCTPFACWNGVKRPLVRHIVTQLPVTSKLVGLEFCRCNINDEVCEYIASMLISNRSIRQLNLAGNNFGAAGLVALSKALQVNDVLKFLGLQGNSLRSAFDSPDPTEEGILALADMLKVNNTLVRLDVLNTGLGKQSFNILGEALRNNSSIVIFDMDTTPVSLNDAKVIKHALQSNQRREQIEMSKKKKTQIKEKRKQMHEQKVVAEQQEEKRMAEWIEHERRRRVQDRKQKRAAARQAEILAEQRRRELAQAQLELAMAAASKKKKKKGKGKKKKKK